MEKSNLITQIQENQLKKDGIKVVDNKKAIIQCSKCEETNRSISGLKYHFSRVHEGKTNQIICLICEGRFHSNSQLKKHIASVHEGIKPNEFVCIICEKKCHSNSDMKCHMNSVHEGKKAFPCSHCIFTCKISSLVLVAVLPPSFS